MNVSIFRVAYILFITVIGLLFFYLHSVELYWQQTYHRSLPIMPSDERSPLLLGATLTQTLVDIEHESLRAVSDWNEEIIASINHEFLSEHAHHNLTALQVDVFPETSHIQSQPEPEPEHQDTIQQEETRLAEAILPNHEGKSDTVFIPSEEKIEQNANAESGSETGEEAQQQQLTFSPEPIVITPQDKILFAGDSLMQGVAPRVKRELFHKYKLESIDLSKQSTGLAYPSVYNWPKVVEETLANDSAIKVLAVFLGPNDPWNYPVKGRSSYLKFKSAQWEATYRYRINRILTAAKNHDVQVLWLGVPCMRKTKLHEDMLYLNSLYRSEVEKVNQHFITTSDLLGCSDELYNNAITTDKGAIKVRIDDGIHFTVPGQRILANTIISQLTINQPTEPEQEAE